MKRWQRQLTRLREPFRDETFLNLLQGFEGLVSKVLSIAMVFVIVIAIYDLANFLITDVFDNPGGRFGTTLFTIFGLFLNVLIALEILENITAYLKSHVIQIELVIVTSLVAVARKVIILDLEKTSGIDLIALAAAIISLSLSYWIIRHVNRNSSPPNAD